MTLAPRLREYIEACFTGLWVQSFEHDDAIREIAELCRQNGWRLATWDIDRGLQVAGQPDPSQDGADPLAAIHSLGSMSEPDTSCLLVLPNFHRLLNSAEIVQALVHQLSSGKQNRTFIVVLSIILPSFWTVG